MTDLEFIESLIQKVEASMVYINTWENNKQELKMLNEDLHHFQQIKAKLEAWEVVKKHCDYQDYDRFNCIPEGFYLIEPIKGKDYLTIKKALEVENECRN